VQKTGTIITSAALLLVVVIGSFAMGQVLFIKEVGIGLGLAILVDATMVRVLLVPATMRLLGRYNWWAPRPLTWLYRRLGLNESESEVSVPATQAGAAGASRTSTQST
jgi:RND superfamily putative drug exporter